MSDGRHKVITTTQGSTWATAWSSICHLFPTPSYFMINGRVVQAQALRIHQVIDGDILSLKYNILRGGMQQVSTARCLIFKTE